MDIKDYKKTYFDETIPGIVADLENLINEMNFADPNTQNSIISISKDKIVIHVGSDKLKVKYSYDLIANINEYLSERNTKVISSYAVLINVDRNMCGGNNDLNLTYDISNL